MRQVVQSQTGHVLPIVFSVMIGLAAGPCLFGRAPRESQAPRDSARYAAWLTKEVHHELVMLPYLTVFDNLEYKVDGARVTLLGQVVRPALKSDAESVVKHIEGVEAVDNQIEVLPLSPMDDRIRRAEHHAIYGYEPLERYALGALPPIRIIVKNGHVTLEGFVANEGDKNLVGLRANTVPGVFSVTNNLQIDRSR